jgi:hypothetical protein
VQCVKETTIAYHAPPNTGSIGIELCDPQTGPSSRWGDAGHEAMLRLAARLVREVAARWKVPLKRLTVADLKTGKHGICGHVDVSNAWHQSDHSDPGSGFPWDHFMTLVTEGKDEEDDMDPNTIVKVPAYWADPARSKFSHPTYSAAFLWAGTLNETRTYGQKILAQLTAQQATIAELTKTVAALAANSASVDPDALVAKIQAAIDKVTVHLEVDDTDA